MCTHSSRLSSDLVLLVLFYSGNRNIFVNTDYHRFGNGTSEILQLRYFLSPVVFKACLTAVKLQIIVPQ